MVTISKKHRLFIGVGLGVLLVGMATLALVRARLPERDPAIGAPINQPGDDRYPWHSVIATVFWIGEEESVDNAFITNVETAWDLRAVQTFGGVDDPEKRTPDGVKPQAFEPKHNPFYMALPAAEFTRSGIVEEARVKSYWNTEAVADKESLFKGRWAEVFYQGRTVFVQWVDVGPFEEFDYDYVFGRNKPKNKFGKAAGIDLSPAAEAQLDFDGVAQVFWRFIDVEDVPDGPWKKYPLIDNKTNW